MKKKNWQTIFWVGLLILFALFIVIAIKTSKENQKGRERFMQFVSESLLDFESYDFEYAKRNREVVFTGQRAADPKNIVILLQRDGEWAAYSLVGPSLKEIKTEEDLSKFDIYAFGIAEKGSRTYQRYINGSQAGTVDIETEMINLYYYDFSTKGFFATGQMPYKSMPKNAKSTEARRYKNSEIRDFIGNELHIDLPIPLWGKLMLWTLFGVIPVILIVIFVKRIKSGKYY